MMLQALHQAGGVRYLTDRALDTPGPFLGLLAKILPTQIAGADGSAISLHLIAAQLISQELLEQLAAKPLAPQTINGHAEAAPTGNLLDQPPPLE
jgi:hypothetical protein